MKPPRHVQPRTPRVRRADAGFALLVTVTLVAFLVLVLVALATFTRVETRVASNSLRLSQSRQHALLALNLALGELQRHAGPDQRVTAPSNAGVAAVSPGRSDLNPHWTGVWRNTTPDDSVATPELVAWLVGGNESDPLALTPSADIADPVAPESDTVWLVNDGSVDFAGPATVTNPDPRVRLPKQEIRASDVPGLSGPQLVGHYAWWVGDEGVKAKVSLVDPHRADNPDYSFALAQRSGVEFVWDADDAPLAASYPANSDALRRVLALNQLGFSQPAASVALSAAVRARFHDLTAGSFSLLADASAGGLKKDLTAWLRESSPPAGAPADADLIMPAFDGDEGGLPRWGLIRSYATDAALANSGVPLDPVSQTDVRHGVYPIITYHHLGLGLSGSAGAALDVHLFPKVVLWNPWNVPLAPAAYEAAFAVQNGNAFIRVRLGAPESKVVTINLHKAALSLGTAATADPAQQYFRFKIVVTEPIPAGESRIFVLDADAAYVPGQNELRHIADSGHSVVLSAGSPLSASEAANAAWDVSAWGGGTLALALRAVPPPADPAPFGYDIPSGAYHTAFGAGYSVTGAGSLGSVALSPVPPVAPAITVVMRANMATGTALRARWMANANLLAPVSLRTRRDTASVSYVGAAGALSSALVLGSDGNAAAGQGVFPGAGVNDNLVLKELRPASVPLFSLAQLQHANLALIDGYPAYAVGNSLADPHLDPASAAPHATGTRAGSAPLADAFPRYYDLSFGLNRALWDRYFFSTVPSTLTALQLADENWRLPNARHVFERGLVAPGDLAGSSAYHAAAAHLLLDGGFNVNATSVQAWRALLAGRNGVASDGGTRTHPFSRFTRPVGAANNQPWSGYRILSEPQIDTLAARIVDEVKLRGPFLSLADFVNRRLASDATGLKGALQAAIDATPTGIAAINDGASAPFNADLVTGVPAGAHDYQLASLRGAAGAAVSPYSSRAAFAPGFLTQADLLTALGPVLTARSDTFVIRAYGDVINPATGELEGRAWCEALVQRLPEYVNPVDTPEVFPPTHADNQRFGRRFAVVSFRWLDANDI